MRVFDQQLPQTLGGVGTRNLFFDRLPVGIRKRLGLAVLFSRIEKERRWPFQRIREMGGCDGLVFSDFAIRLLKATMLTKDSVCGCRL